MLVLGALTILSLMLSEIQDESSAEFSSSLTARDLLVAEYAARSAANLTRLLIASEPTMRRALAPLFMMGGMRNPPQLPVWEFADRLLGPFNDPTASEAFISFSGLDLSKGKNLGLPGASFDLVIVDEESKINVNSVGRPGNVTGQVRLMNQLMTLMMGPQYDPLFEGRDKEGNYSDRQAICAAIMDWADDNQDTANCNVQNNTFAQSTSTEDSFYEMLDKPFRRKNAAYDSLLELRRVRGMTDDFWATFVEPDADNPKKRLLTVWGSANAININTASPQNLLMLICSVTQKQGVTPRFCTDPAEMQKLVMLLTMARGFLGGAPPFESPRALINTLQGKGMLGPMLVGLGIEPIPTLSADAENEMTTESKVFSIYATGIVKAGKRETRARVHTVIDFRGAPPPTAAQLLGSGGTAGTGGTTAVPPSSGAATGTAGSGGSTGINGALAPNPAGNVVYFRLD